MRRAYEAGSSARDLASLYGCDHKTVLKRLRAAGTAIRPWHERPQRPKLDQKTRHEAVAVLRAHGWGWLKIARAFGVALSHARADGDDGRTASLRSRSALSDAELAERYANGATIAALAQKAKISTDAVYRRLKRMGVATRSRGGGKGSKRASLSTDEMAALYRSGLSLDKIGERAGVSGAAVHYRLRLRDDVQMRSPNRTT